MTVRSLHLCIVRCYIVLFFVTLSAATCTPGTVRERGISDYDKDLILGWHNYYRAQIALGNVVRQPKSSNMLRMSWDALLEDSAQQVADTCVYHHVKSQDPRFVVGQNIASNLTSFRSYYPNWPLIIYRWYEEEAQYEFGFTYCHYTQIVWAETHRIGCGYVAFDSGESLYRKLYVCNYGPAGNIRGEYPYETGMGCDHLCEPEQLNYYNALDQVTPEATTETNPGFLTVVTNYLQNLFSTSFGEPSTYGTTTQIIQPSNNRKNILVDNDEYEKENVDEYYETPPKIFDYHM